MSRIMDEDAIFMTRDVPGDAGHSMTKKKGDCGCGCKGKPGGCMDHDDHEDYMNPGEAFGAGVAVGKHEDNYMIAPQLRNILDSASEILELVHAGHTLEPWQESHIAQISDDIDEVQRSLVYGDDDEDDIFNLQTMINNEDLY